MRYILILLVLLSVSCESEIDTLKSKNRELNDLALQLEQRIHVLEEENVKLKEKLSYAISNYRVKFPDDDKIEGEFMQKVFGTKK